MKKSRSLVSLEHKLDYKKNFKSLNITYLFYVFITCYNFLII